MDNSERRLSRRSFLELFVLTIVAASNAASGSRIGEAQPSQPTEEPPSGEVNIYNFRRGIGSDNNDYVFFACSSDREAIETAIGREIEDWGFVAGNGSIGHRYNPDGSLDIWQVIDPQNPLICGGDETAGVFFVHDQNPLTSPGVKVGQ